MEKGSIEELLRSCVSEDSEEGWEEFVRRFDRRLAAGVRRALRRLGAAPRQEVVEEMVQEVYCRLLDRDRRALRGCRGRTEGQVVAYLYKVAESAVIDLLRLQGAVKRGRGSLISLGAVEGTGTDPVESVADPALSPEERILLKELRQRFLATCNEVVGAVKPQRNLRILQLAILEGWSSREISRGVGGLKPSSVDSLVHRMKRRLGERGVALPPGSRRPRRDPRWARW